MDFERRKVNTESLPQVLTYKWSTALLDEGYIPFPKRLLRVLPQFFSDVRYLQVVLAVVDYARPNLSRAPSYEYLAFNAGMTVDDFKRHVTELQQRGLVSVSGPDEAISITLDGLKAQIERATEPETIDDPFDDPFDEGTDTEIDF